MRHQTDQVPGSCVVASARIPYFDSLDSWSIHATHGLNCDTHRGTRDRRIMPGTQLAEKNFERTFDLTAAGFIFQTYLARPRISEHKRCAQFLIRKLRYVNRQLFELHLQSHSLTFFRTKMKQIGVNDLR